MPKLSSVRTFPTLPYLERYPEQGGPVERVSLRKLPFTIGRSETADHTVYSSKISKEHAAIVMVGDRYAVRDLDSTNGTFVNSQPTAEQFLEDGDIIHVAHVEFCFRHHAMRLPATGTDRERTVERTQMMASKLPDSLIRGTELLRDLIRNEEVEISYEPIVDLQTRQVVGYEALGRGKHPGLGTSPDVLFRLAERCKLAIQLSQLFCRLAVTRSETLPRGAKIFVNLHPRELASAGLVDSLATLRQRASADHPIVIEIPESSVTDVRAMARHKEALTRLGFEFAYDDFGAGQTRLIELVDIPPNYLKFDKTMIQGIEAAKPRQDMVAALLRVVGALGVRVIAEGIETEEAAVICHQMGCGLGQGFLFCSPAHLPASARI